MTDTHLRCIWCHALGVLGPDGDYEWVNTLERMDPDCEHESWQVLEREVTE